MFLGMPVAFAVGVSSLFFFLFSDTIPAQIGVQRIATATQSFPLLAVPLFVLAGNLMNSSGITDRIIALARALTGWISGGLAQVAIVVSALMGGVSGSAVADAAMEARILGPSMLKQGFSRGFSSAVIAVGSLITATIPPSIGLILYGFLGNVSIGKLFLGGVIPGILMTVRPDGHDLAASRASAATSRTSPRSPAGARSCAWRTAASGRCCSRCSSSSASASACSRRPRSAPSRSSTRSLVGVFAYRELDLEGASTRRCATACTTSA